MDQLQPHFRLFCFYQPIGSADQKLENRVVRLKGENDWLLLNPILKLSSPYHLCAHHNQSQYVHNNLYVYRTVSMSTKQSLCL